MSRPYSPGEPYRTQKVKQELLGTVRAELGPDYDIATRFTRATGHGGGDCVRPGSDLFKGIASGKASVVTDEIERFTETGIQLKSAKHCRPTSLSLLPGFI